MEWGAGEAHRANNLDYASGRNNKQLGLTVVCLGLSVRFEVWHCAGSWPSPVMMVNVSSMLADRVKSSTVRIDSCTFKQSDVGLDSSSERA